MTRRKLDLTPGQVQAIIDKGQPHGVGGNIIKVVVLTEETADRGDKYKDTPLLTTLLPCVAGIDDLYENVDRRVLKGLRDAGRIGLVRVVELHFDKDKLEEILRRTGIMARRVRIM